MKSKEDEQSLFEKIFTIVLVCFIIGSAIYVMLSFSSILPYIFPTKTQVQNEIHINNENLKETVELKCKEIDVKKCIQNNSDFNYFKYGCNTLLEKELITISKEISLQEGKEKGYIKYEGYIYGFLNKWSCNTENVCDYPECNIRNCNKSWQVTYNNGEAHNFCSTETYTCTEKYLTQCGIPKLTEDEIKEVVKQNGYIRISRK